MRVEVRREQLMDAAIRVISAEGAARATTRRIAAEVGAPLVSIHYSFRTKEELFDAVYEHCLRASRERLLDAVPAGCGIEKAVRALMKASYDYTSKKPQHDIAMYELLSGQARRARSRGAEGPVYPEWFDVIAECYDRATDGNYPRRKLLELARATMAVIDGTFLQMLVLGDDAATRRMYAQLTDSMVALAERIFPTPARSA